MRFRRNAEPDEPVRPDALPSAIGADGNLRLQCWYCEQEIAYEGYDPCAVILVTNWAGESRARQREQQFFAHAECFRSSGSGSDLYILAPDFDG
jgi:hypothetical protein